MHTKAMMTKRRSTPSRAIVALSCATLAAACVTWAPVTEPLSEALANTQDIRVTTVDSVRIQMQGDESNPIRVEDGMLVGPLGEGAVSLPLEDIAHVEMAEGSSGRKTAFFGLGVVAIAGLLLVLMSGVEVGDRP